MTAAAAAGLLVSAVLAEQATVKTKDGQTFQGDVTEQGENVIVTIHGVQTVLQKANVASIEYVTNYDEDYKARLAKLDPKDIAGRVAMAREAFDRRRYELARDTLEGALSIDPNSREASDMLDLVQRQIRLERARTEPAPPRIPAAAAPTPPVQRNLLTAADVEKIRKKELKPTDAGVRIRLEGDVKRRFAESQNMPFAELNAQPLIVQALAIMDKGDDSMKSQVRVLSDPHSMAEYRRQVQPAVLLNCATSSCHGGPAGGKFILFTPADNELVAYTNFYIMQKFQKKPPEPAPGAAEGGGGGIFGGSAQRLIDRGHGDASLLVNYGLPTNIAESDHPPVNGALIKPVFRSREDARLKAVVEWMNNSLVQVEPDYQIDYTPPTAETLSGATQPATAPAEPAPAPTPAPAPAPTPLPTPPRPTAGTRPSAATPSR
jgi:hypothetical protein